MGTTSVDETTALDELFDVLSDSTRRRILTRLNERTSGTEPEVPVAELAREGEGSERKPIRLLHSDLPKLDAAGFIDWDRNRQVVRPGRRFTDVAPLIELLAGHQDELPSTRP